MELLLLIFIVGYLIQDIGSIILLLRIHQRKSIDGLSLESQALYFLGTILRLMYVTDTRLASLSIIWIELVLSLSLFCAIFRYFYIYSLTKYVEVHSRLVTWKIILPVCIVLSYFFHPGWISKFFFYIITKINYYIYIPRYTHTYAYKYIYIHIYIFIWLL
jgi:ER lumen protein retaining receptor